MSPPLSIRPYSPADRAAVRAIAHSTGYMGEPAGWLWRDTESFADLTTGWYTDFEPESALVVTTEPGDDVVGYLLGCVDSRRKPALSRTIARHAVGRALLLRPGTAGTLWKGAADIARELGHGREVPDVAYHDESFPSHLHIDLLPVARGGGVGRRLVTGFLERAAAAGSPGCHIETIAENKPAIAFFERLGFASTGVVRPMPGWRSRDGVRLSIAVMTKPLS